MYSEENTHKEIVTECSRENRNKDENRKCHESNLHFLQLKLPSDSQRQPDASILHYSCLASDKAASSPEEDKRTKVVNE